MSGFWAGTVPSWALVCGGCLCVLFLLLGAWFGVGRRDRAYDEGYDDGQADMRDEYAQSVKARQLAEEAGVAMVKAAGMRAWELTHPAPLAELPPPLAEIPTVREEWAVPLEYPPGHSEPRKPVPSAGRCADLGTLIQYGAPAYAYEPWSLSAGTTVEEAVRAMIANADAAPSVRWLAALETGQ